MRRSKSLNFILESSGDTVQNEGETELWEGTKSLVDDSGIQSSDGLMTLEKKVDKLSAMCMEQTRALSELTELVRAGQYANFGDEAMTEVLKEVLQKMLSEKREDSDVDSADTGAQNLLSAIELRPSLERRICDAVANLLQSEDLKDRLISVTAASIKEQIRAQLTAQASLLVPVAERSHRQLLKQVSKLMTTAFADLEESTAYSAEALQKAAEALQPSLQRNETLLQEACATADRLVDTVAATTERVLQRELDYWHEKVLNVLPRPEFESNSGRVESPCSVSSTTASQDMSIVTMSESISSPLSPVDRMMMTAEINKLVKDGDVNGALCKALLHSDLSLVEAACRAAAPALPARPPLAQPVLLSLLQQLATDLVVETQLKCCFMEYALQNLNPADPVTKMHLPFVVGELDKHIANFSAKWPNHTLFERVSNIVVTARNLI